MNQQHKAYCSAESTFFQQHIPLKDKNWFNTGGAARLYVEPTNAEQLCVALTSAQQQNLSFFVLGSGANILISDEGFDGLVIKPALSTLSHQFVDATCAYVTAGAGITMHTLIEYCLSHNLLGLEEFSGIPGTVGGSVYINLHYFEFLLAQFLVSAEVVDCAGKQVQNVDASWFEFDYNQSKLHEKEYVLVNATFKLIKGNELEAAYARGRRMEIIRHREKRYPEGYTCGSFFRNFFTEEVRLESNGKKIIWAAYYLEKAGIKGVLQHGDAIVSYQHANMIVNQANATTHDIVTVARAMQQVVLDKFGILPQPECQLIGFKKYPLL